MNNMIDFSKNILSTLMEIVKGRRPLLKRRSHKWKKFRENFLIRNDECAVCGSKNKLEVHHKLPFQFYPTLELSEENCITLCESRDIFPFPCHLYVGHWGNFKTFNPFVDENARKYRVLAEMIKSSKRD